MRRRQAGGIATAALAAGALALAGAAAGAPRPIAPIGPAVQVAPDPQGIYTSLHAAMNRRDTAVVGWTRLTPGGPVAELRWRLAGRAFGPVVGAGRGRLVGLAIAGRADRVLAVRRAGAGRLYGALVGRSRTLFDGRIPLGSADPDGLRGLHVRADGSATLTWWRGSPTDAPVTGSLVVVRRPAAGGWRRSACASLPISRATGVDAVVSPARGLVVSWQAQLGDPDARTSATALRALGDAPAPPAPGLGCPVGWTLAPEAPEGPSLGGATGLPLEANRRGDVVVGSTPVRVMRAGTAQWQLAGRLPGFGIAEDVAVADDGTVYALAATTPFGGNALPRLVAARLDPATGAWARPLLFRDPAGNSTYEPEIAVQGDGRAIATWAVSEGPAPFPARVAVRSTATGAWSLPARRCSLRGNLILATGNRRSLLVCAFEEDDTRPGLFTWEIRPWRRDA